MENSEETIELLRSSHLNIQMQCKEIADDVSSGKTTMFQCVLNLAPYFEKGVTSDSIKEGINVLSTVLRYIPISSIKQEEVSHLCQFYAARLKAPYMAIPVILDGILSLSNYDKSLENKDIAGILHAIFQTVSCQAQQPADRLKIYKIFRNLLRNQTEELLNLGPDFIYGVISAIDGERYSLNLIFVFGWLPEFINTVNLGHLFEEMYDVISCYFPVDFRTPTQDVNGISRDALAEALKPCLCASNQFAESTIDLILEKLESDLYIAKIDSLHLLMYGCKKFTIDIFIQKGSELWWRIQAEILKSPLPDLENLLLASITEMARKISPDQTNFVDIFDRVLETSIGNINAAEKLFRQTCKLFLAMSRGNEICSKRILDDIQPRLMNLFNITATKEHKLAILRILIEFIKVGDHFNTNLPVIYSFLTRCLVQPDQDIRALSLEAFCYINSHIPVNDVLLNQWSQLFVEDAAENVQRSFHQCISFYADKCPERIVALIQSLPMQHFDRIMDNLCALSSKQLFIKEFLNFQVTQFEKEVKVCLRTLNKALNLHKGNDEFLNSIDSLNLVENQLFKCFSFVKIDESDLTNAMEILVHIIGNYSVETQFAFVEKYSNHVLSRLESDKNGIYFACSILSHLYLENLSDFGILERLFKLSCQGNKIAVELLANQVNKLPEDKIGDFIIKCELVLKDINNKNQAEVVVWITKALFMREHEKRFNWLQLLLSSRKYQDVIANGMKTIMRDDILSLSSASHCRKKILYKQEFFSSFSNMLETNTEGNNEESNMLFASLVKEVPLVILKLNFERCIRFILSCLTNVNQPSASITIMTTIINLLESKDKLSEQYLDDLMPRLMSLARESPAMKVRTLALKCIRMFLTANIPEHKLIKHKSIVMGNMALCLDDKKRLVRKEAADARLSWSLLCAPI